MHMPDGMFTLRKTWRVDAATLHVVDLSSLHLFQVPRPGEDGCPHQQLVVLILTEVGEHHGLFQVSFGY